MGRYQDLERRVRKIELEKLSEDIKKITENNSLSFEEKLFRLKTSYTYPMCDGIDRIIVEIYALIGIDKRNLEARVATIGREYITAFTNEVK